jgi:hypothetical protein
MTTTLPKKQTKNFNHWFRYMSIVQHVKIGSGELNPVSTKSIRLTSK